MLFVLLCESHKIHFLVSLQKAQFHQQLVGTCSELSIKNRRIPEVQDLPVQSEADSYVIDLDLS